MFDFFLFISSVDIYAKKQKKCFILVFLQICLLMNKSEIITNLQRVDRKYLVKTNGS